MDISTSSVVGIDPSLTATGIAHLGATSTVGSRPCGPTLADRRARILTLVSKIELACPSDTTHAIVEAPSLGQARQGGTLDRNGLWWLLVHHLAEHGISVIDVPPATVKKLATGKGNATKPDMRMALYRRTGIDLRDDNQVDAWWLWQIGLHLTDDPARIQLPTTHTAALTKINTCTPVAA